MEEIQRVEENGKQIDEMVAQIIGDRLDTINAYISDVRTLYLTGQEILDDDLAKISLRIPTLITSLFKEIEQIYTFLCSIVKKTMA